MPSALGWLAGVGAAAAGPAFDVDYQTATASLVGKYLVAELVPLPQPEDVACSIPVALQDVGPSEEAWLVFVAAHQQLQPSTSNSFEVELGTGRIQQVFQDFDCPILPGSTSYFHQDTSESARWLCLWVERKASQESFVVAAASSTFVIFTES